MHPTKRSPLLAPLSPWQTLNRCRNPENFHTRGVVPHAPNESPFSKRPPKKRALARHESLIRLFELPRGILGRFLSSFWGEIARARRFLPQSRKNDGNNVKDNGEDGLIFLPSDFDLADFILLFGMQSGTRKERSEVTWFGL